MDVNNHRRHGVLRAYVLIISMESAFVAILIALHIPWRVVSFILILALTVVLIGKRLIGATEYVQISSPVFEARIQSCHRSESNQLTNLGFTPLFFYGESFPLFRLLLIYPAFLSTVMVLNGEVATVEKSKLLFGYQVFISPDKSTYAHATQLGMKFHSLFQDGTILMTKNFGGKSSYGQRVVVQRMKNASISDSWAQHQGHIQALEADGKQIDQAVSFQAFAEISHEA